MKELDAYAVELSGQHLIEASAGTGKTHAITTLYLRAVVELGLLPEQILVVTFTRAATGELRERIRLRLRQAQACLDASTIEAGSEVSRLFDTPSDRGRCRLRLQRALLVIDQAAVMTIHGFCAGVLEQNAFESRMPFGTKLVESLGPLLDEIVNDFMIARFALLNEEELLAMRSIGIGAELLRDLGGAVLGRGDVELEPMPSDAQPSIGLASKEFDDCRKRALDWLGDEAHLRLLGGLNKTKPAGTLGSRLIGYLEKTKSWLEEAFHRLNGDCETFQRLFELADKYPASKTPELLEWFSMLSQCSAGFAHLRRAVLDAGVRLRREFIEFAQREFEARKAVRGVQTYDDLLRRLRDALSGSAGASLVEGLRARYPLALIDEFQDTDPLQFDVFSSIYKERTSLFLIGDPKQSIYAFRGADVDNYRAAKANPRVQCHTICVNWRSDPGLIAGVQRLYRSHADPFLGAGIDYVDVVARPNAKDERDLQGGNLSGVRIRWLESEPGDSAKGIAKYRARQRSIAATVEYIEKLLATRPSGWGRAVRASEIAVLGRTNRECQATAHALRARGIRCVQTSDASVLASEAADSLGIFMRALLQPSEQRRVTAWLVDPLAGKAPAELESLRADIDAWEGWVERLWGHRRIWERSGLLAAVVRLCDETDVKQRLLEKASGERFITDLLHVAELTQAVATQQRLTLQGQLEWLAGAQSGEKDCSVEEQQLRIEADSDAVLLTTVHRSKGLQFPFVVCPFLWDAGGRRKASFLEYRRRQPGDARAQQVLHLEPRLLMDDAAEFELVRAERLRENARLLYVALTRAKHQVAIVWTNAVGIEQSALGQLLFGARSANTDVTVGSTGDVFRRDLDATRDALLGLCDGETVAMDFGRSAASNMVESDGRRSALLIEPQGLSRVVVAGVQTTSYSALTAVSTVHADVGRDVDALLAVATPEVEGRAGLLETGTDWALPLVDLPAGTRTGEALHAILEKADFQRFERYGDELDVAAILARFGLDGREFEAKVRSGLGAALNVELMPDMPELKLSNVAPGQRCAEFEFLMKVKELDVARLAGGLGPELTGLDPSYAQELGRLRFEPVTGYLRGFIDLVFEHAGRFYVVDYKSNALGKTAQCFEPVRLKQEMQRHHYPVQAALYASAVDQWLRIARLDYDYERHFGGVFYLFLRGMAPALGAGSGVFFHRPKREALGAFEAMIAGRSNA